MRTLLLFLLLMTMTFIKNYCQTYERFVIEGAHWEMAESYSYGWIWGYPYPQSNYTYWYKLEGDTIIDTLVYKKLFVSAYGFYYPTENISWGGCDPWAFCAIVREDTLLKKVFFRGTIHTSNYQTGYTCDLASQTDTLLYDFSHSQGDTLRMLVADPHSNIGCNDSAFVVDTIDYSGFGQWQRRTIHLKPAYNNSGILGYQLFEGIGPSYGIFGAPETDLECLYCTTLVSYCIGPDSFCHSSCIPTGINDIVRIDQPLVYPNPFSTQFTFSLSDNEPTTISLYNFLGQQILQQTFTNSTTINTAQLANGIYFYELRNSKGAIKNGKVIKQ